MNEPQSPLARRPSADLDALRSTKTILLTTYKRDGTAVGTPVSIAFDGPRAFFRSWHKAWKTKRIARNPAVLVQSSDLRGRPKGLAVEAVARLLEGDEAKLAARALARRHRVLQGLMVPLTHRLMRYRTMHYELIGRETEPPAMASRFQCDGGGEISTQSRSDCSRFQREQPARHDSGRRESGTARASPSSARSPERACRQ